MFCFVIPDGVKRIYLSLLSPCGILLSRCLGGGVMVRRWSRLNSVRGFGSLGGCDTEKWYEGAEMGTASTAAIRMRKCGSPLFQP